MTDARMPKHRHVLGLSGGRDSAALAVFMRDRHPELPIEYFFTDTGKELPEVYEFLGKLEGFLGREIVRLNPHRDFDFWLRQYNHFLPSVRSRWCTRQLKLKPFEDWIAPTVKSGGRVTSYVAIRADEYTRSAYTPTNRAVAVQLPFVEDGIDLKGVLRLLRDSGIGLPEYYDWRTRSGCTFCFFQQKIEWVGLLERHPDAFEAAKRYEKDALEHGTPFTWSQGESLDQLADPDRIATIRRDHAARAARLGTKRGNALHDDEPEFVDLDELYGEEEGGGACLICHK